MAWTDAPTAERCTAVVILKDGSTADCGRRGAGDPRRCWQHAVVLVCPFCEHMPDDAEVRVCGIHAERTVQEITGDILDRTQECDRARAKKGG